MEPAFEVRYISNHRMLAEYQRKFGVGPRPFMAVICVLFFVYILWQTIAYDLWQTMSFYILVIGLVLAITWFLPDYVVWASIRNMKKQNDGILPETVITFGDAIQMNEGMAQFTIEYRKIVRTVRLKHSYMLMIGKRNGVILEQDSFTKGTFEEFKQFLREKRPDLTVVE